MGLGWFRVWSLRWSQLTLWVVWELPFLEPPCVLSVWATRHGAKGCIYIYIYIYMLYIYICICIYYRDPSRLGGKSGSGF